MKYGDYVKENDRTVFVEPDAKLNIVKLRVTRSGRTVFTQTFSPGNATMIAYFLERAAKGLKP